MSILNAFDKLCNTLLESAATDEFKQLLGEIAEVKDEIKTLQKEVSDGWTRDYTQKLNAAMAEIQRACSNKYIIQ